MDVVDSFKELRLGGRPTNRGIGRNKWRNGDKCDISLNAYMKFSRVKMKRHSVAYMQVSEKGNGNGKFLTTHTRPWCLIDLS